MDNKVNNIEDSKTTIINSELGKALGFTEDSSWNEIIIGIANVVNYSESIQTAITDTSNNRASCYRINGEYVDIIPAIGYWGSWDWAKSCIQINRNNLGAVKRFNVNSGWNSEYQINFNIRSLVPDYNKYTISNFLVQLSLLTRPDDSATVGISYSYSGGIIYVKASGSRIFYAHRSYPAVIWFSPL